MSLRRFPQPILIAWTASLLVSFWFGMRIFGLEKPDFQDDSSETTSKSLLEKTRPELSIQPWQAISIDSRNHEERRVGFTERAQKMGMEEIRVELAGLGDAKGPAAMDWHKVLLARWAEVDLPGALEYANGIDRPKQRYDLQAAVLETWARSDPAAAWAYASTDPDSALSEAMHDQVLKGMGQLSPAEAFRRKNLWKACSRIGCALMRRTLRRGLSSRRLRSPPIV